MGGIAISGAAAGMLDGTGSIIQHIEELKKNPNDTVAQAQVNADFQNTMAALTALSPGVGASTAAVALSADFTLLYQKLVNGKGFNPEDTVPIVGNLITIVGQGIQAAGLAGTPITGGASLIVGETAGEMLDGLGALVSVTGLGLDVKDVRATLGMLSDALGKDSSGEPVLPTITVTASRITTVNSSLSPDGNTLTEVLSDGDTRYTTLSDGKKTLTIEYQDENGNTSSHQTLQFSDKSHGFLTSSSQVTIDPEVHEKTITTISYESPGVIKVSSATHFNSEGVNDWSEQTSISLSGDKTIDRKNFNTETSDLTDQYGNLQNEVVTIVRLNGSQTITTTTPNTITAPGSTVIEERTAQGVTSQIETITKDATGNTTDTSRTFDTTPGGSNAQLDTTTRITSADGNTADTTHQNAAGQKDWTENSTVNTDTGDRTTVHQNVDPSTGENQDRTVTTVTADGAGQTAVHTDAQGNIDSVTTTVFNPNDLSTTTETRHYDTNQNVIDHTTSVTDANGQETITRDQGESTLASIETITSDGAGNTTDSQWVYGVNSALVEQTSTTSDSQGFITAASSSISIQGIQFFAAADGQSIATADGRYEVLQTTTDSGIPGFVFRDNKLGIEEPISGINNLGLTDAGNLVTYHSGDEIQEWEGKDTKGTTLYLTDSEAGGAYQQVWQSSDGRTGENDRSDDGSTLSTTNNADGSSATSTYNAGTNTYGYDQQNADGTWSDSQTTYIWLDREIKMTLTTYDLMAVALAPAIAGISLRYWAFTGAVALNLERGVAIKMDWASNDSQAMAA